MTVRLPDRLGATTAGGRGRRVPGALVWIVAAWTLTASVYALERYRTLQTGGFDLGIFDQAIRNYSRFRAPLVPLKGDHYNILGDHFHPILALLAPLYWIWDDPRVLLLAQVGCIAWSIVVVHRFAARHLPAMAPRWINLFTLGYAFGWPIQVMIDFDFHEIALGVPLLAIAIDALDRRRPIALAIACGFLLGVREDMGILVAIMGVVALLQSWRDNRSASPSARRPSRAYLLAGAGMVVVGPVVYEFATRIVLPHYNPAGTFQYWSYEALGPDLPSAVRFMITHPLRTTSVFFTPWIKTVTLAGLLCPVALLCLRSPYVLIAAPLLAERFFSSRSMLWYPRFHYNAPVWVIVVMAALDGASRLPVGLRQCARRVLIVAMSITWIGGTITGWDFAFQHLLTGQAFRTTQHLRDQRALLARIPADVCVGADEWIAGQLTHRDRVSLPFTLSRAPDFVALDLSQTAVRDGQPMPKDTLALELDASYRVVFKQGQMILLQRPGYSGPSEECAP